MMLSVGRAVEFLASQVMTALGNHVLAKRDSLLRDHGVCRSVVSSAARSSPVLVGCYFSYTLA